MDEGEFYEIDSCSVRVSLLLSTGDECGSLRAPR